MPHLRRSDPPRDDGQPVADAEIGGPHSTSLGAGSPLRSSGFPVELGDFVISASNLRKATAAMTKGRVVRFR